MSQMTLRDVDRIEIRTLMDNYADVLLESTDVVTRQSIQCEGQILADALMAEHGLSQLVRVHRGEKTHTVLFDAGYSSIGVPHNVALLGLDLDQVEAIVLSHGHMDHTGSLNAMLEKLPAGIPLVVHPDAFRFPRYYTMQDGTRIRFPRTLIRDKLESRGFPIWESTKTLLIAGETVMITGEVERTTPFETGLPNFLLERDGAIVVDPISDDQAMILSLKGKGLVVVSGCAHAGIINTINFARKITSCQSVHAVLGGFHLAGPAFDPILEETIAALKEIAPNILVPMHCTGWKAIKRFSEEFPNEFILNSVGSTFTLS
jgi:7,8-dihydropterin-6-yl-methyl-4-(beta-D-ribofuranosyl)aminobenzene 5'-phosphate synthase